MEKLATKFSANFSDGQKNHLLHSLTICSSILVLLYSASLSLPITIPWSILTVGLILMVGYFALCRSSKSFAQLKALFNAPLTAAIAIFCLTSFISGLANGGITEAFRSFWSWRGMLVYFWAFWLFQSSNQLKMLCVDIVLSMGAISGCCAAVEQLTGFHPFSFPYLQGTGFISGPMAFAGLAQLFAFLGLGIALKSGYKDLPGWLSKPVCFYLVLIGNWLGIIFCGERSAWLGAAVASIVVSALISMRAALLAGTLLVASTIVGWLALPVVRERLNSLLNWQSDVSVSTRIVLWEKAWQVFKQSPICGVGIRHFPHLYIPEALQQGHLALDHAHSNYLHILATMGLLGTVAYIYLWFKAVKLSYKDATRVEYSSREKGICLGIFAGTVSLLVSGLFEYNFGTGQIRLAQWFLLAMLCARNNRT